MSGIDGISVIDIDGWMRLLKGRRSGVLYHSRGLFDLYSISVFFCGSIDKSFDSFHRLEFSQMMSLLIVASFIDVILE